MDVCMYSLFHKTFRYMSEEVLRESTLSVAVAVCGRGGGWQVRITGLTEPHQGTPGRMPNSCYSDQTQPTLQRKSNRDSGSSVERLSFGSVSLVVSSAELPRLWFVPVISVSAH